MIECALTLAGSDPTGGAGVQADIKTFSALGVYGLSIITSLTAQNSTGITGIYKIPPSFLSTQWKSLFDDFQIKAIKIGMVYQKDTIEEIAKLLQSCDIKNIVLDPLIKSTTGSPLLERGGLQVLKDKLFPLVTLITPNLEEAESLIAKRIMGIDDMKEASFQLQAMGPQHILIKGGCMEDYVYDIFFDGKDYINICHDKVRYKVHGTGCMLSAAIAAGLAKGLTIYEALSMAQEYSQRVIHQAIDFQRGYRYPNHIVVNLPDGSHS